MSVRRDILFLIAVFAASSAEMSADPVWIQFTPGHNAVVGVQFDLHFDPQEGGLTIRAGDALRKAAKELFISDPDRGVRRVLIVGLNQNVIEEGPLVDIFVNGSPETMARMELTRIICAGPEGDEIPADCYGSLSRVPSPVETVLGPENVLNAASLLPGAVAPGEVITILGPQIGAEDGNLAVSFDGVEAVLLYVSPHQINAVVPAAIAAPSTHLKIARRGHATIELIMPVAPSAPAIFTRHATGTGQAVLLNADAGWNSGGNAANRGDIVTVYATGIGQGEPAAPVSARVGGVAAEIIDAVPAGASLAGVTLIRLRIPPEGPSGPAVPLILSAGDISSQPGVTLAVQ